MFREHYPRVLAFVSRRTDPYRAHDVVATRRVLEMTASIRGDRSPHPVDPDQGESGFEELRRITVPVSVEMVNLLGPRDEFLRMRPTIFERWDDEMAKRNYRPEDAAHFAEGARKAGFPVPGRTAAEATLQAVPPKR